VASRYFEPTCSEHTGEDGTTVFEHACRFGLEGIVSKQLTAPYRSGPSCDWIKVKNLDSPAMIRHREGRWEKRAKPLPKTQCNH
jgi:ATP-dependent DNA ligase